MNVNENENMNKVPYPPSNNGKTRILLACLVVVCALLVSAVCVLSVVVYKSRDTKLSSEEVSATALNCTISIETDTKRGSAVAVKIGGQPCAITNFHVLSEGDAITAGSIRAFDIYGNDIEVSPLGYYAYQDIAVVKLIGYKGKFASLSQKTLSFGQTVYASGNNAGQGLAVFNGIISRPNKILKTTVSFYPTQKAVPVIQTTASINAGMSGGGLFDEYGKLIGINTYQTHSINSDLSEVGSSGETSVYDMNYAVPIAIAKSLADAIYEQADFSKSVDVAEMTFDYDNPKTIDATVLSAKLSLVSNGLRVDYVADTPTYVYGGELKEGDVIIKFGSVNANNVENVFGELYKYKFRDERDEKGCLILTVRRGDETKKIQFRHVEKR